MVSLDHGAYSERQIRPIAARHRRNVLRQLRLRAGDLDPIGKAYFDAYVRLRSKIELIDGYVDEHGLIRGDRQGGEEAAEATSPGEEGSLTLPKQWCFDFLRDGILWVEHVSVLVTLLGWFENGQTPPRISGAQFEIDGGDLVLVVDVNRFGFGGVTEEGLPGWKRLLDRLVDNDFFEADRRGKDLRIRLGSRTLAARKARPK